MQDQAKWSRSGSTSAVQRHTARIDPGKRTLAGTAVDHGDGPARSVQRRAAAAAAPGEDAGGVHAAAEHGLAGAPRGIPHGETIQRLFGKHDVSAVRAQVGGPATEACQAMGAEAYASGDGVAFAGTPDLHTAAHEAAHVVQQRGGVQLKGGVGQANDRYEQHADAVADRVARGESAEALLDEHGPGQTADCPTCGGAALAGECQTCRQGGAVQRQAAPAGAPAAGACHGTNRTAGPQHEAIQAHYTTTIDPTGVREYAIPAGSLGGNVGYADIVSLGTGAIYEIKPYIPSEIASGKTQVAGYLAGALASCGVPPAWHLGFAYPDSVIPFGNQELVAKQYNNPGLILYYTRKKREQPSYERVVEVVVALGLSLAMVAVIIAALLDPEPATKLALAGLSVVMIGVVLERFGMAEPGSEL